MAVRASLLDESVEYCFSLSALLFSVKIFQVLCKMG